MSFEFSARKYSKLNVKKETFCFFVEFAKYKNLFGKLTKFLKNNRFQQRHRRVKSTLMQQFGKARKLSDLVTNCCNYYSKLIQTASFFSKILFLSTNFLLATRHTFFVLKKQKNKQKIGNKISLLDYRNSNNFEITNLPMKHFSYFILYETSKNVMFSKARSKS